VKDKAPHHAHAGDLCTSLLRQKTKHDMQITLKTQRADAPPKDPLLSGEGHDIEGSIANLPHQGQRNT
jgi:hypothetical protein